MTGQGGQNASWGSHLGRWGYILILNLKDLFGSLPPISVTFFNSWTSKSFFLPPSFPQPPGQAHFFGTTVFGALGSPSACIHPPKRNPQLCHSNKSWTGGRGGSCSISFHFSFICSVKKKTAGWSVTRPSPHRVGAGPGQNLSIKK